MLGDRCASVAQSALVDVLYQRKLERDAAHREEFEREQAYREAHTREHSLYEAIRTEQDIDVVKRLLRGTDFNWMNTYEADRTFLALSCEMRATDVTKALIRAQADVNLHNRLNMSPLQICCYRGYADGAWVLNATPSATGHARIAARSVMHDALSCCLLHADGLNLTTREDGNAQSSDGSAGDMY